MTTAIAENVTVTVLNSTLELFDVSAYLEQRLGLRVRPLVESIVLTIVYCAIFTTGVFGNICTGVVVWKRAYMHTPTNLYLCSLAISDLLTLLLGQRTVWLDRHPSSYHHHRY